jgi:hypothetical protein
MRADVNLCEGQRSRRLRFATLSLGLVLAHMIVLAELKAPPLWWLTLVVPLAAVSFQVTQAYSGVCVGQARKGVRRFGGEVEPILDPHRRRLVQERARSVTAAAVILTAMSIAIVMLLVMLN